ncbi:MAG: peptidoglycan-binding protein [Kibdelosporangium sp.]
MVIRAAVLAMFTAGIATATGIAGAGTALACQADNQRSDRFAASLPQVNYGDTGTYVVGLQLALRGAGYSNLTGTGTYAQNTLSAVQDFQQKHGINPSGIVGSKTWHALVGVKSPTNTGEGLTPPSFGITPGEHNENKMNHLYNAIGRVYPYYAQELPGEYTTYGPGMQQVVQDFQRRAGINPSGIVGPQTWDALYKVVGMSAMWGC